MTNHLRIPHSAFRISEYEFSLQPSAFSFQLSNRGSVLIYVVWLVMLLSLFTASVGSQALFALDLSERLSGELGAVYVARGAVPYIASAIQLDPSQEVDGLSESWADNPGLFDSHPIAGGTITLFAEQGGAQGARYGLDDEEQRISLNGAPADVLRRLFELAGGLGEQEAADVAAAIEDWRDPDDHESPGGAESSYYHELPHGGYDCKDGPFENMEELLLVKGVTPELYRKVEPYLTVYGSGRLNLNTASPTALRALGLSKAGIDGLLDYRVGEDNLERTSDDRRLSSVDSVQSELEKYVPVEDRTRLIALTKSLTVGSTAFRTTIRASSGDPAARRVTVACVIDRRGLVKRWEER